MTGRAGPFWRIRVDVPAGAADAMATALEPFGDSVSVFERGASSVSIEVIGRTPPDETAVSLAAALAAASAGVPAPEISIDRLQSRDWLAENRKSFPPFSIGRYFIHGSDFHGRLEKGAVGLELEAGAAFGTGRHASTEGCLRALDRLAADRPVARALDLGCGSAILAIAIAKTWAARVLAADIDSAAVGVARANITANGVANRVRAVKSRGFDAPALRGAPSFDLIVANIQIEPLVAMAEAIARHGRPGGVVVLSGVLEREGPQIAGAYARTGLRLNGVIHVAEWLTLLYDS